MKKSILSLFTMVCMLAALLPSLPVAAFDMGKVGEYQTISAGDSHTAAIKKDGSLWTWGSNGGGELGDGTEEEKHSPVKIMDNAVAISAGGSHTAAIKEDGSLWTWGYNSCGQLGDGTIAGKSSPVKIMDNVAAVSAGEDHTAAIKEDGSLWTWGRNDYGRLGDGTTEDKHSPIKIMDNVVAVSAGTVHTAAIKEDGSLWTWGSNYLGQLGDGTTEDKYSPIKIMDNAIAVSARAHHTAAIKEDGSLWTWGRNDYGELGDGTTEHKYSPVKIMDNAVAVLAGACHRAAIKEDGSLWTWGANSQGQLGDGTTKERHSPVKITDNAAAVSVGWNHTAAIKEDGSLWTWGENYSGQLGNGTTSNKSTPVKIMDGVRLPGGGAAVTPTPGTIGELDMPEGINNVTINHKGTAYGYFAVTDQSGAAVKNKAVSYTVDGGSVQTLQTDEYGYLCVQIDNITESHDYEISISGNGIDPYTGTLSVTVTPLEFSSTYNATVTTGADVGIGIGVGGSIGNLKAEAEAAEIGASGSNKKGFSYSQEREDGKTKLTVTAKQSLEAAVKAKAGLWAGASADVAGAEISAGDVHGSAKYGNTLSVGFEDDDFSFSDSDDVTRLARFMVMAMLENMSSNVATQWLIEKIGFSVDTYEKGSTAALSAGASIGSVTLTSGDKEIGGVALAGIDGDAVWSQSTKTSKDGTIIRKSSVAADAGVKLLDVNIFKKSGDTKINTGPAAFGKNFVNNNVEFSMTNNTDGDLESLGMSLTDNDSNRVLWNLKSTSTKRSITYSSDEAKAVASSYGELNDFVNGNKGFFSVLQMYHAANTILNSNQRGKYVAETEKTKGIDIDVSASAKLFLKLGATVGLSGTESYSYETESGIYDNNIIYTQAKNDIDSAVEEEFFGIEDAFAVGVEYMNDLVDQFCDTASDFIDKAGKIIVESGKAAVEKTKEAVTGWTVDIIHFAEDISPFSIMAVDSDVALFSTSSVATTVGNPYIISVTDESGNAVTDLSSNPLLLTIEYTDEDLAAAGVTDISDVEIYRWNEDKCVYVRMGGTLDEAAKTFSLEITRPGQYILAADNCPPAVTEFKASHNGIDPEITAIVSDMSGIADFEMTIDGITVINNDNLDDYYSHTTAELVYPTSGLAAGTHTAVIYASDTSGNALTDGVSLEFTINTDAPVISNVTSIPEKVTGSFDVSAEVTGESISAVYLNVEETGTDGRTARSTYEMSEENGIYRASANDITDGAEITVWVSAYSVDGNAAQSEKQQSVCVLNMPELSISSNGDNSVTVSVANADSAADGKIILAIYNSDGVLTKLITQDLAETLIFTDLDLKACTVKAMLWNSISGMKPLTQAVELD